MRFRDWINQEPEQAPQPQQPQTKKWQAKKAEIIQIWNQLQPNTPITAHPIPAGHEGKTYGEDGVRVTGSPAFIGSILSRLKDFLRYESKYTKLDLVYKEVGGPTDNRSKQSFAFYIQVQERSKNSHRRK